MLAKIKPIRLNQHLRTYKTSPFLSNFFTNSFSFIVQRNYSDDHRSVFDMVRVELMGNIKKAPLSIDETRICCFAAHQLDTKRQTLDTSSNIRAPRNLQFPARAQLNEIIGAYFKK